MATLTRKISRHRFVLPAAIAVFLAADLAALWWLRGEHVAGWELLGPAHAKALIHEQGAFGAIAELWRASRDFQYWNPTNSVLYGFVPGWLSSTLPWLYWAQVFNLVLSGLTLWLASLLPLHRGILWAAVAASPALITHLIVGYPYISGALPYAAALLLVDVARRRPAGLALALEAAGWVTTLELSFHCYELGKTFFVVPALASLCLPRVAWRRRLLWFAVSLLSVWAVLAVGKANVEQFTGSLAEKFARLPGGAWFLARAFLKDWFLDGPALAVLAVVCAFWIRRDRTFWRLGLLVQIGLLLLGAIQFQDPGGFLRPRRALLFLEWSAWMVAWTWRDLEHQRWKRVVIASLLVFGQGVSAYTTVRFARERSPQISLPYTYSQIDYKLDPELIGASRRLRQLIELDDQHHFIFYGYSLIPENTTDPQALLERLYLQLPDPIFRRRVLFVDQQQCRYSCVPHPLEKDVASLLAASPEPFYAHVYRSAYDRNVVGRFLASSVAAPVASPSIERFDSFVVQSYSKNEVVQVAPSRNPVPGWEAGGKPGFCVWKHDLPTVLWLFTRGREQNTHGRPRVWRHPLDLRTSRRGLYYFEGVTTNSERGPVTISIDASVDDELVVLMNGQSVIDLQGPRSEQATRVKVMLPPGQNVLAGYYSNLGGIAVLRIDARFENGRRVPWSCPRSPSRTGDPATVP